MNDCNFPEPWNISRINPELHVYGLGWIGDVHPIIKHSVSPTDMITVLSSLQLISAATSYIIFIAHGFLSSSKSPKFQKMKNELLNFYNSSGVEQNATVILLNWEGGADIGWENYYQAASNMQSVANWLSPYLQEIKNATKTWERNKRNSRRKRNWERRVGTTMWGIGHSLGAHLLGIASRNDEKSHSEVAFQRISGLDPAGPCFEEHNKLIRLRSTDATKTVDVIHTDGFQTQSLARLLPIIHAGTLIPLGTVDFYPNWGFDQPATDFTIGGSHRQAVEYFTWSISNPGKFFSYQNLDPPPKFEKPSYQLKFTHFGAEMGFHYRGFPKGKFYLETNSSEPWK